ncbi:AT-rich interactive domain-containing protein 5B [Periophthalmus magnuspinnatus]|uniref:AT-rich interactive domain-containing protein 5B n=1 Tax=Periophthalmus magnuspinnatus TaxID=409849 RepID=UPI00145B5AFF|nr:AT-rich interactive domain-containing protein 5B [Periophthalmus magnuspinnatus]
MEPNSLKWVGSSCGLHGPYIFYKAFKFHQQAKPRILSLGDFFFVRCKPEEPICIAELQLLWEERTSKQLLSSSKLYFLPEDTPQGRTVTHGEHEVIAVSEKVIVRLQDLVKWAVPDSSLWGHGLKAEPVKPAVLQKLGTNGRREALHRYRDTTWTSGLNFKDVQRERAKLGQEEDGRKVLVLSYPQYCRYRSLQVRLRDQPSSLLIDHTVLALGGIAALGGATRILYCRDTFEHPSLLHNDSICDQFAPNLKGRPRKKKLSVSQRRDSQSQGQGQGSSGSSGSCQGSTVASVQDPSTAENKAPIKVKPSCKVIPNGKIPPLAKHKANNLSKKCVNEERERAKEKEKREEREVREVREVLKVELEERREEELSEEGRAEEQAFLVELYKYMKERDTPIERIPFLGFKQINLWTMFQAAQKLGGYELITVRRQWKHVYDELGGNPSSTSAATCTRRHYERLLLPYERHIKGEQDKPLPLTKPRKQEGGAEKVPGAKLKGLGTKKPKNPNNPKQAIKKERGDATAGPEQSQDLSSKDEIHGRSLVNPDEPIVIEEEELHLTLKEETLSTEQGSLLCPKEPDYRSHVSGRALLTVPCPPPEWRQISDALQVKLTCEQPTDGHFLHKNPYLPHRWDHHKPTAHIALPETTPRVKDTAESHGGRVGKVLPMCKQLERQSTDSSSEDDYGVIKKESAAYKAGQGVMSPLAKKKLLSQVCESNTFAFSLQPLAPPPSAYSALSLSDRDTKQRNEDSGQRPSSDGLSEVPIFRPSVIQHAQSTKTQHHSSGQTDRGELSEVLSRGARHIQPQVNAPWQPYLSPDASDQDKLVQQSAGVQSRGYAHDCYSSPHLNSLYRQTETCLSQDRLSGFTNGEGRREYGRERDGFVCIEPEGLAFRSHYSDRSQDREAEDEPRDFSISKQRLSSVSKSFCALSYPIMHQSLESHPKACKVTPMTVSPSKQTPDTQTSFPSPKTSSESSPNRPSKRSVAEAESEDAPQRKVRVVTPIHPTAAARRSDPEELKAAEPAHAVHLNNHIPEGHPATAYPHAALYSGLYAPSLVSATAQDGLQQHPGLQYLKSQSAVSPLVPPLAFHSMMLHRQLLAASPSAHAYYRHPGGAALYGDLLHHLYPLSTLPPPQLSSVHPSTRL